MEKYFDHEKLDVYQAAIGFVVLVDEIITPKFVPVPACVPVPDFLLSNLFN